MRARSNEGRPPLFSYYVLLVLHCKVLYYGHGNGVERMTLGASLLYVYILSDGNGARELFVRPAKLFDFLLFLLAY